MDADATNIRLILTLAAGAEWTTLPNPCLTTGVMPISSISGDKHTLLCNIGNHLQGYNGVINLPVRSNDVLITVSGNIWLSGHSYLDNDVNGSYNNPPGSHLFGVTMYLILF